MEAKYHLKDSPVQTALKQGKYGIWIIGGKSVDLNGFQVMITNTETKEKIQVHEYSSKLRMRHGIRCWYFDVKDNSVCEIVFRNPEHLVLRKSMLFTLRLFHKKIPLKTIEIGFEKLN